VPRDLGNRDEPALPPREPRPFDPPPRFRDGNTAPAQPLEEVGAPSTPRVVAIAPILRRQRRTRAGLVLAVIVILGAGATVAVMRDGRASRQPAALVPIHPIEETKSRVAPSSSSGVIARGPDAPFVVAGARFTVSASAHQPWATFTKRSRPRTGSRWLLVTVKVGNLTRAGFDPRVLHYRVIDAGGTNYFPNLAYGTGADVHRPARPVPVNKVVQAELAFQVPTGAARLRLAFDPTGRHERVVVALS
jgi:hypothetical protein